LVGDKLLEPTPGPVAIARACEDAKARLGGWGAEVAENLWVMVATTIDGSSPSMARQKVVTLKVKGQRNTYVLH
jgi:hypothetical protein